MKNVVNRVLSSRVSKGVEESEWIITARIYRKANFCNVVISSRSCLSPTQRAGIVGITDAELVVILGIWAKILSFDLGLVRYLSGNGRDKKYF